MNANAHETAQQNRKPFFYKRVLEFLGNHQRVSATKLLKLLYPNVYTIYRITYIQTNRK
jgi:hypothetical protein